MTVRIGPAAAAALLLATLALAAPGRPRGDDWPAPQIREVFAPSREYFVRVIPGKGIGETVGFRGAPTGPPATARTGRCGR
ncbi:MAG TPA: hypothetical protein VMC04_05060 [Verrucomicrobiae bacterium]|jgi:hypothetical protein|nr:hypothetical protein [Verrucomicrobiae bacterium]